jgi:hypothetical protein
MRKEFNMQPIRYEQSLIEIRAEEEILEHGSVILAIRAVGKQIDSSDLRAERSFMRRVLGVLKGKLVSSEL